MLTIASFLFCISIGSLCSAYTLSGLIGQWGAVRPRNHKQRRCLCKVVVNPSDGQQEKTITNTEWLRHRLALSGPLKMGAGFDTIGVAVLEERLKWLQHRLSLSDKDLKRLISRFPRALLYRSEPNLEETLSYLQNRLELSNEQLRKLVLAFPQILGRGIDQNQSLERNIEWAKRRFQLDDVKQLRTFFLRGCQLLSMSVEENLDPTVSALGERLELDDDELACLCRRHPPTLQYNFSTSLGPKLDWYQERFQLTAAQLGAAVKHHPNFLDLDLETNVKPSLSWLKTRIGVVGTNDGDDEKEAALKHIFLVSPSLLSMKPSTLAPKIDCLQECLGEALATEVMTTFPPILTYSLERRLRPRLKDAAEIGIVVDLACMRRIGTYTNDKWAKSIEYQTNQRYLQADRLRDW